MANVVCEHTTQIQEFEPVDVTFCQECIDEGLHWVALRQCLTCGHVGCCDSSPGTHATNHFEETGHAIMKSVEPGEEFTWCYIDEMPVATE